jgi:hypothetical protein
MSDTSNVGNSGKLVFHHLAGQYFLSEVHFASGSEGILFSPSKLEKRVMKLNTSEKITPVEIP